MGGSVKFTLNTKQAIRQFKRYDDKTRNELTKVVAITSRDVYKSQISTLRAMVKKWTGGLARAIHIKRIAWHTSEIGPAGRVNYDWYIEDGSRHPLGKGGGFGGYNYVRDSVEFVRERWHRRIKAALNKNK